MAVQSFKGFIGGAYQSAAQRMLNLYFESVSETGGGVLYGTPGLILANTLTVAGNYKVLGMMATPKGLIIALENAILHAAGIAGGVLNTVTVLTTTYGPSSYVSMAQCGEQWMIVNGVSGIYGNTNGLGAVTSLTGVGGFPVNPLTCAALDGMFLVHGTAEPDRIYYSGAFNAASWNALDYVSAENLSDTIRKLHVMERELYVVGDQSTEVWATVGGADVFDRIAGTYIPYGTPAFESIASIGGSMMFFAQDQHGGSFVVRCKGLSVERISTHAVEANLDGYAVVNDAYAFCYQQEGHAFYVLTFPSQGNTWVFDLTTSLWHERSSQLIDIGAGRVDAHWSPRCAAYFGGTNLVGGRDASPTLARIYELRLGYSRDEVGPIRRLRASPHIFDKYQLRTIASMEFIFQAGVGVATGTDDEEVNPQVMLRISKDGGQTYGYQRTAPIGAQGEYRTRAKFNRLGRARDFIAEMSISAPVPIAIAGANLDFTP